MQIVGVTFLRDDPPLKIFRVRYTHFPSYHQTVLKRFSLTSQFAAGEYFTLDENDHLALSPWRSAQPVYLMAVQSWGPIFGQKCFPLYGSQYGLWNFRVNDCNAHKVWSFAITAKFRGRLPSFSGSILHCPTLLDNNKQFLRMLHMFRSPWKR